MPRPLEDYELDLLDSDPISAQLPLSIGDRFTFDGYCANCVSCGSHEDDPHGRVHLQPENCLNIRAAFQCNRCGLINLIVQRIRVLPEATVVEVKTDDGWRFMPMVPTGRLARWRWWLRYYWRVLCYGNGFPSLPSAGPE